MKVLALFLALCSIGVVHAAGTIIFMQGQVHVAGQVARHKQKLKAGQLVETSGGGLAIIALSDGSKIKLERNSRLRLTKGEEKRTSVAMEKGQAFFHVMKSKLKSMKTHFKVKAENVSMGVRGTEFFVALNEQDVWMCVREGAVAIKSKKDRKEVLVEKGEGVVSKQEGKTSDPKPLDWTRKLNWNMDRSEGDVVNKVSIQEAYSDLLDQDYD